MGSAVLMLVPQTRLLVWVGFAAMPFAALAAMAPDAAQLCLFVLGGFAALVLLDAVLGLRALSGVSAAFENGKSASTAADSVPVFRFTRDYGGDIDIFVSNASGKARQLRVGLALPPVLESPHEAMAVQIAGGHHLSRVAWPCTPLRRGRFVLDRVYLEAASPLGFWAVRGASDARAELRVYPNLFRERRQLSALFTNRGAIGIHALRQVGKGREFEKLREYVPGDGYDEIHWKATAKRGHPITKVYQIERTQEVYVVLDGSRLSARTVQMDGEGVDSIEMTQFERFVTAALILGIAAERQGDLFGVLTFGNKVNQFVRARSGKAHYSACRDAIYNEEPRRVTPDFDELCSFIRLRLRRRALLVFLTNLDDPVLAEGFARNMDLLRQHLVLVNMIAPPKVAPLFTGSDAGTVDGVYDRLAGHLQWHDLRELERVLHRRGVSFSLLNNETLCAQLVTQYINIKQRQIL
jgi:uncharacterized protein (DUF58 family)